MRLLLIRHGQTPSNVAGALDTALPGPGLTDLGRAQAQALPQALASEEIEGIWVSRARRARETATPLGTDREQELVELPGAHEISAGAWEMNTDPESVRNYIQHMHHWTHGDPHVRLPGGETGSEALARMDESISTLAQAGVSTGVVVSHGAMIRIWSGVRSQNLGDDFAINNPLDNTGIVVVEGDPDTGWVTRSWMGVPLGGPGIDDLAPLTARVVLN